MTDALVLAATSPPSPVKTFDLRIAAFLAALVLYGALGSPTPEDPGLVEVLTGLMLVFAAGGARLAAVFRPDRHGQAWERAAQALLFYGLTLPVFTGLAAGNGLQPLLRDVIPFLFLLLPLFLRSFIARPAADRPLLTLALMLIGLLFALRVTVPLLLQGPASFWHPLTPADPFYLANAPTVLFTALLLLGLAGRQLYLGAGLRRLLPAAAMIGLSFFPLVAMALVVQRASMAVVVLYIAAFLGIALARRPARALLPLLAVLAAAVLCWPVIAEITGTLLEKTELVGVNMRGQEAAAVFTRLADSPLAVLFGRGWGASVASPAVGGLTVNFTHSLLTTYWLKTGLCGLALVLVYLGQLGRLLLRLLPRKPLLAAAIAGPLLIDITLYASFKSLDFGLVLLLIPLWAPKLHQNAAYSME